MVVADGRDDADYGPDDVGGVVPASQPGLQDHHVALLTVEVHEGHGREELEEVHLEVVALHDVVDVPEQLRELLLGDGRRVQADPLREREEVRGGVQARPHTRALQQSRQLQADSPLPVRTRHVHELARVFMGVPQVLTLAS